MALTNAERQAKHRAMRAKRSYKAALDWLYFNDCRGWWMHNGPASITASFVADCYGRTIDQVRADLRAMMPAWESSPGVPRYDIDD